tara:strand:- start:1449 stop:2126 length:678 start_codon:yes stop_codon:yes gene_type:complete
MIERKLDLPRKDENGVSKLSYSQIACYKKSKTDYIKRYILEEPFIGNAYTDFGSNVGESLENNSFESFSSKEQAILKTVERLDIFERPIKIDYKGFYVNGFIDACTNDLTKIIDYKTGGNNKEFQYSEPDYTQLQYYAIGIKQETRVEVKSAEVHFIRRNGNAFRGQELTVANESPLVINVDVSKNRLGEVYWDTVNIALEIEKFYSEYKEGTLDLKNYRKKRLK